MQPSHEPNFDFVSLNKSTHNLDGEVENDYMVGNELNCVTDNSSYGDVIENETPVSPPTINVDYWIEMLKDDEGVNIEVEENTCILSFSSPTLDDYELDSEDSEENTPLETLLIDECDLIW